MKPLYLIIGLDFGTSCAKAVVQAPYLLGGQIWAVNFGKFGFAENPYLLPSRISISPEGYCTLGSHSDCSEFRAAKEVLLEIPDSVVEPIKGTQAAVPAILLSILFNALAIKAIRQWFLKTHGNKFSDFAIKWQLNIGVPSKGYDDQQLREHFRRLAIAAWRLSETPDPLTITMAEESYFRGIDDFPSSDMNIDDINVIPEVIAEFVGYARSDQRRDGVQVIIDVGANTLDVCAFNLYKEEGEDRYPFITAIVTQNGCLRLHQHRISTLKELFPDADFRYDLLKDPMQPIPSRLRDYFAQSSYKGLADEEIDRKFLPECLLTLTQTIDALVRLDGRAPEWHTTGIPMFFCGGGSLVPLYHVNLLKETNMFLKNHYHPRKPFVPKEIPMPDALVTQGYNRYDFHRLAVAFGLSFPASDIGKILSAPKLVRNKKDNRFDLVEFYGERFVPKEYS